MSLSDIARDLRAAADELERRGSAERHVDPLAAAERVAIAEEIASLTRHDLRNKLASVRNATFYLKRRVERTALWKEDANVPRFFSLLDEQVIGAISLLEEGMSLRHLFARRIGRASGRQCVERAVACVRSAFAPAAGAADAPAAGHRRALDVEIDGGAGEVNVDVDEVALALRCLIENAAEASDGPVSVSARTEGNRLLFRVSDSGPGIAEKDREDIYKPLFTTKDGHAGLGLGMARRIARRYQGDVTLEPSDSGASFALALPLFGGAQ